MSTLSFPNTFAPATTILSAAVNANFAAAATWGNGNIDNSNFGTLTGVVTWSISSDVNAISITSSSTGGVIGVTSSGVLSSDTSALSIVSAAAQTAGKALAALNLSNASSTIPVLRVDNGGTGAALQIEDTGASGSGNDSALDVNTTTKGVRLPRLTTAQRDAISSPQEGLEIYHITLKRKEFYDGAYWRAPNSGEVVAMSTATPTLRPDLVYCNGDTLADNGTNAFLRAHHGPTLPDYRRRTLTGDGGTATAGPATTVGSTGGAEAMEAHVHAAGSLSTVSGGAHVHGIEGRNANGTLNVQVTTSGTGDIYLNEVADPNGGTWTATTGSTGVATGSVTVQNVVRVHGQTSPAGADTGSHHVHAVTGSVGSTGTGTGQGNWQPTTVVKWYMVL